MLKDDEFLRLYKNGNDLNIIIRSLNLTKEESLEILKIFKEKNRFKNTFTEDFKKVIAERDSFGISRNQISYELGLSINTIRKACEKYGQKIKEKASSENLFTKIDGNFEMSVCPSCKSKNVNKVDDITTYCKDCGNEHEYHDEYVLRLNWEYLD